jgi:predicted aldo/keto reductase-like oxidoreductase
MSKFSRRDFLTGVTAAAGAATLSGRAPAARGAETAAKAKVRGTDMVKVGRTGIKTSVLGLGTGTKSGNEQRDMGQEGFTKFVRYALDRGIHYIDTADGYRTHPFVAKALAGIARDKYFIQTKTRARTADSAKADIDRFLKELNTEYIDSLLMHCMMSKTWVKDMRPVMDALEEAKKKGKIRAMGVSCHGWDPMLAAAETDWPDVQLVRINPFKVIMDNGPADVAAMMKKWHDAGRGIIGMKIFGETGLKSKDQRRESLKYVLGLGSVDCFTIGFSSIKQLDETLELIES